jgi:predicted DNA-binding antitoxin AbrB/MazE fold protein
MGRIRWNEKGNPSANPMAFWEQKEPEWSRAASSGTIGIPRQEGFAMTKKVKAVFEKGVLRPLNPLPLAEGMEVEVTLHVKKSGVRRKAPADILAAIAKLPLEGNGSPLSGRDHDAVLYGKRKRKKQS